MYFHGGSLVVGGATSIQAADGAHRRRIGTAAVVVAAASPGLAGWLALPSLAAADARGGGVAANYGLLDAIAALRRVASNAARSAATRRRRR